MPRRIALLVNPRSGRGRGRRTAAIALPRLTEAGFAVELLEGRDAVDAAALAQQVVADGLEALVVCGGDGLVHVALNALVGSETALGIIPAGTGNDVARSLGVPRHDPQLAADVVVASRVARIDLGQVGDTCFATVLAAGFDSRVNERANAMRWPRGQMRYNLATLAELRVFRPLSYTLDLDGTPRTVEAMLVAVGNGPSFGGGLRITHGACLDDGELDVVVIRTMSRTKLVRTYPRLFSGSHVGIAEYEHHRVRRVVVDAPGVTAYADGEQIGPLPLMVQVRAQSLKVLVGP